MQPPYTIPPLDPPLYIAIVRASCIALRCSSDLIKLKRVTEKNAQSGKTKKNDAMISKFAGGLCFDFSAKDSNMWVIKFVLTAGAATGFL